MRSTFASNDDPINPAEIKLSNGSEEGFDAQETHASIDSPQALDSPAICRVLYADAKPYVRWYFPRTGEVYEPVRAFRQHLKLMLGGLRHHLEDTLHKRHGYILVEQIGHAVNKD
jgi:hypothetical protein